ncbi:MAG: dihydroneopterin aldolase [Sphingobacterium sp.]
MGSVTQYIALKDVRFFSPIGFYEEEQVLGNEFYVDLVVSLPFQNPDSENLDNTINYEGLYQILIEVMGPARKLLESAAEDVLNKVLERYAEVQQVTVEIRKMNPPFGGDLARSVVSLDYQK